MSSDHKKHNREVFESRLKDFHKEWKKSLTISTKQIVCKGIIVFLCAFLALWYTNSLLIFGIIIIGGIGFSYFSDMRRSLEKEKKRQEDFFSKNKDLLDSLDEDTEYKDQSK